MAQVFIPSHFPYVTDVILYATGVSIGMLLASHVLATHRARQLRRST